MAAVMSLTQEYPVTWQVSRSNGRNSGEKSPSADLLARKAELNRRQSK